MPYEGRIRAMNAPFAGPRHAPLGTDAPARAALSLADLPMGQNAIVSEILTPTLAEDRDIVLRLIEIGFVPGEPVCVVAQGFPGREPIAVRLGGTTFALRRFEAEYVRVVPVAAPARARL